MPISVIDLFSGLIFIDLFGVFNTLDLTDTLLFLKHLLPSVGLSRSGLTSLIPQLGTQGPQRYQG